MLFLDNLTEYCLKIAQVNSELIHKKILTFENQPHLVRKYKSKSLMMKS